MTDPEPDSFGHSTIFSPTSLGKKSNLCASPISHGHMHPAMQSNPTPKPENRVPFPYQSPLSHVAHTFPPVLQQEQIPFPSLQTPNALSPAGGVGTGSPIPHLSTPLGPPLFAPAGFTAASSAATSPATRIPVGLTPISSLSNSSSPHFPIGSFNCQHPVAYSIDDSQQVLFSATKILKQKKLANVSSLGFGALFSPWRGNSKSPPVMQRHPHRCKNCGAYANFYCQVLIGSGEWKCVVCEKLNESDGEYIARSNDHLCGLPELASPVVDYIQTMNKRSGSISFSDTRTSTSSPIILVIDDCLDEQHLFHLQGSLHAFVDSLTSKTKIGMILYSKTVSIYDFSEVSTAHANVLPGDTSPKLDDLNLIFESMYLSSMDSSKKVIHNVLSSLRPYGLHAPEALRDRCLGVAIEVALALIRGPSLEAYRGVIKRTRGNSRVIVCAGGPTTCGPGSVPHFNDHWKYPSMENMALKWVENLGHSAGQQNTVIDILCAGTCPVRIPLLQPLVKASGGVLILHDDFGETFSFNLQRAFSRASGAHGLLQIHCSDGVFITQVVGPGKEGSGDARDHETFKNSSALSIQMPSIEQAQSFALCMETKADIKKDYLFFQFAIHYSDTYQTDVLRVITMRLPAVDSASEYLESVREEVVAVLIAKKTLLKAKSPSAAIHEQTMIDERIKDIAKSFCSRSENTKSLRFPKELSLLPELLFHLRRGPLLGNILGHEEERLVLRNLFLNASFDLSLRMMAPRLFVHHETGTFEELPAHNLAMQSKTAVLLDHGTDLFIWLGEELAADGGRSAAAIAACRVFADELTKSRFPAPRILSFKEGNSQARYFLSRLIPAHKDPPYEQDARFPQLQFLTSEVRKKLQSSFLDFDEPSFCEWIKSLNVAHR